VKFRFSTPMKLWSKTLALLEYVIYMYVRFIYLFMWLVLYNISKYCLLLRDLVCLWKVSYYENKTHKEASTKTWVGTLYNVYIHTDGVTKNTNSWTRPYGSSIERPTRVNQAHEVIVPSVLDDLVRPWTDEVHEKLVHP